MDDSYSKNEARGYISFAAPSRELDVIPTYPTVPHNSNSENIDSLLAAENFLYLINPDSTFTKKAEMINALIQTDYDVLIVDAFFDGRALSTTDVSALKNQPLRTRLVVAYMSIGEAEDYRYYWQTSWATSPPPWLAGENPDWEGNYKVRYWMDEWQNIIYGSSSAYLDTIMSAGFDGVYLDIIDAFEYFE
jgi:cysteinyl-tRNA synthetase